MQTLETPRLILRSWSILDLVDFFSYASDPEIGPAAGWKPHVTREDTWEALRHNIQADDGWAIALRETGKVIGSIKLRPDPKRPALPCKMVGYSLSKGYWGNGYMTEAVGRVLAYAFEEEGLQMVTSYHQPGNDRSRRVILRCGFAFEGILRGSGYQYDGSPMDEYSYSLTREEYFLRG
ncbi:MAG TPA: GNAT family N-acetyltransferase [Firmicutes bacterium]|nr:GNAT family N-acetyltransferase [Bacillota bacterium]